MILHGIAHLFVQSHEAINVINSSLKWSDILQSRRKIVVKYIVAVYKNKNNCE
jgi:hypothetical protein